MRAVVRAIGKIIINLYLVSLLIVNAPSMVKINCIFKIPISKLHTSGGAAPPRTLLSVFHL